MTLVAWDSFYYGAQGWTFTNTGRSLGAGQSGYPSLRATLGADAASTFGMAPMTELIVGFCLKTSAMGAMPFLRFQIAGSIIGEIAQNTAGAIEAWRGPASVLLGTSLPGLLVAGVEAYLEVRVKFSASVGEIEVRLNGAPTPVLDLGPVNVGGSTCDQILFYSKAGGATRDHSAFYLVDPLTGSPPEPTDFLGHIRFGVLDPLGNGASSELLGSDGNSVNNYALVDDGTDHDGDSTYVGSSTVGETDTYAVGDLPTAASIIYAVAPIITVRKTDAGTRAIAAVVRSAGTDYPGDDEYLSVSYRDVKHAFLEDPATSSPWDEAGISAMEIGLEVSV